MKIRNTRTVLGTFFALVFFSLLYTIQLVEQGEPNSSINNIWDAFWYAAVTLTTVGYGDSYPVTMLGKILGLILILLSIGLLSFIIGNITSQINRYMEKKRLGQFGTDFNHHVIILGWNQLARLIVEQIVTAGQRVVVVSESKEDIEVINELFDQRVFGIFGSPARAESMERANVNEAASVYINAKEDGEALVTLINLRQTYSHISIVVQLSNTELKSTFINAGATYVIPEQEISSKLVASFLFEPEVALFTEDLITTASEDDAGFDMQQYYVSQDNPYVNRDFLEVFVTLKKERNTILVGLGKEKEGRFTLVKNPPEGTLIHQGDYLLVISDSEAQTVLEKDFRVKQGRRRA